MRNTTRRELIAGMAAIGFGTLANAAPVGRRRDPDLGANVLIVDADEPGAQAVIDR